MTVDLVYSKKGVQIENECICICNSTIFEITLVNAVYIVLFHKISVPCKFFFLFSVFVFFFFLFGF